MGDRHILEYSFGKCISACEVLMGYSKSVMMNVMLKNQGLLKLNEGFTEVIRRKNKGKMADQQAKSGNISGIWLNKPKPRFYRPKPVKENAHGKGSSTKPKEHMAASTPNQCVPPVAKKVNEGLASKPSSSRGAQGDESDENEISSFGGCQDLEDEVDDYDGYEAQFYDDQFDIRLKGRTRK
ncbi:hypothetical protein Tco_0401631 [Tanacetum coccineum]